ncbi:hypothetical protein SDRG_10500 [Saprolegnia diclina VS20]|uniref:Nudix hydrolase domain-containing protein n=1 Tax=Saprolegnia diclina (strain VS20) TaxID=1156394 RepID=T0RNT2_SAPDV|nr:hypothetical protein SDRG_10500 [Saprolegnia diclina VS20]EQC31707.1 hypothetical protein SDRG_10500 [Saprolegnia diclina VS20]|eukprot:XP_008614714.1 hypothetical protein SDRG_10500 [Saprolegnia diclina VS20]
MSRFRAVGKAVVDRRLFSHKALKLPEYPVDTTYLVAHYTAPALAAGFSDREQTLRRCAKLLEEGKIDELALLLQPFRGAALVKDKPPTTDLLDAFSGRHLDRIRKRLNRLPRQIAKASAKRAAVVIPLCTMASDGSPHVIFTLRSSQMRFHRGEVCFPGGMVENIDNCIEDTCLREMEEEVGVRASQVNVLGVLRCDWSNVASITGVAVTPVVGHIADFNADLLRINASEVESLFTVPLSLLVEDKYWIRPKNATPVFTAGPHVIWGLTAYILDICVRDVLLIDQPLKEISTPEPESHFV